MNSKKVKEQAEASREYLSEVFDNYANEKAPEALKKEVFSTLDTMQLAADLFDLFTIKFGKSEGRFLEGLTNLEEGETSG